MQDDKARLIAVVDKYKANLIAERVADSLIDYIRAPYSRTWLVDRILSLLCLDERTEGDR